MTIVYSTGGQESEQLDLYVDPTRHGELEVLAWKKGLAYLMQDAVEKFQINPMPMCVSLLLRDGAWVQVVVYC